MSEGTVSSLCHVGAHHECVNGPGHPFAWCECGCHKEPEFAAWIADVIAQEMIEDDLEDLVQRGPLTVDVFED